MNNVTVIWSDVILPYFVGGLLPGIGASAVFYYLVRMIVAAYQARRRARRVERAHRRLAEKKTGVEQAGVEPVGAAPGGDAGS
ncbi:MAG TPA: hypothetical protein VFN28_08760 [Amaricoccus sp.]|nr:hypothetical protein [Amaricoccus sp.]